MAIRSVQVQMPEWVWGRLASIAANRKTTTGELIADAIEGLIAGTPEVRAPRVVHMSGNDRLEELGAEVRAARREGYRPPRAAQRDKFTRERRRQLLEQVADLHELGLGDVEIAKRLGIGGSTVQRYRVQLGLPVIGKSGRPANEKENAA